MNFFETLDREARARQLPFLVIGGFAVVVHGYARTTGDLDLLVGKTAREAWLDLAGALGYTLFHDGGTFLQLSAPSGTFWPLDLMLVGEATFAGMMAESQEAPLGSVVLRVPSLRHLLALKCHALKTTPAHRVLKDLQDVTTLVDANRLDVRDEQFKQLVLKYGHAELYERLVRMCG